MDSKMKHFTTAFFAILISYPANAQEIVLDQGFERIIIWRSEKSREEGRKILESGSKSYAALMPLVACIPKAGTKAVILAGKRFDQSKLVVITSGEDEGCRGHVEAFYLPLDAR
jgi:hypothetical protein